MQLDHYLFFNKISQKDFAKMTGIRLHTVSLIVNKKQGPSLLTALRIYHATNKMVTFMDMLLPNDKAIFDKFYSDLKKMNNTPGAFSIHVERVKEEEEG